jgi:uncharacterized protein YecE (DUF72 family)
MAVSRTRKSVSTRATKARKARFLVGTASWADPGFTDWYPPGLPARDRLTWYARHFNLVEVNTSYYAIPTPKVVAGWCDRTPDHFIFDVKLFQLLSRHRTTLDRLPRDLRGLAAVQRGKVELTPVLEREVAHRIIDAVAPLRDAGKLGALLLQLTPAFGPREHSLEELDGVVELFADYKLAVELRHRGWLTGEERETTEAYFRSRHLAYVTVDAPPSEHFTVMPPLDLVTRPDLAYLRAHGRNTHGYLHGKSVAERFDYDYPEAELREIAARAAHLAEGASEVHIVYNNNRGDYALRAATRTGELMAELAREPANDAPRSRPRRRA